MTGELTTESQEGSLSRKLLSLFLITYIFLYMFLVPAFGIIPLYDYVITYGAQALNFVSIWVGKTLLSIPHEKLEMPNSEEGIINYVKLISLVGLSLIISLTIFLFTKKQKNHTKLYSFVLLYARYFLGLTMLGYGFSKVYDGQFVAPGLHTLEEPFGNFSPIGVLWTFMGYSKTYAAFTGLFEIVGGFLLFFRRTTALGALIIIGVMINVVMLNFCFDVTVKLFSCHLLLISIFILSPDIKRLVDFFIFNKTSVLSVTKLELPKKWMRVTRIIVKPAVITGITALYIIPYYLGEDWGAPYKSINGTYRVTNFILNRDTLPPLTTDTVRWSKLLLETGAAKITTMADSSSMYGFEIDSVHKTLKLISEADTTEKYSFIYENKPDNYFSISGIFRSDTISVLFKKKTLLDYPLIKKKGFHWVNDQFDYQY